MAVTLRLNQARSGIELIFPDDARPSAAIRTAMKEQGFRWHNVGKYWFARQTEERMAFAQKLAGVKEETAHPDVTEAAKAPEPVKSELASAPAAENTFASVYDKIGSFEIRDGAQVDVHSIPAGMYCKDLNALIRHNWGYDDYITVTDLTNAGKTGKTCITWHLYPENHDGSICNDLSNKENIHTCRELMDALRAGKTFENIRLHTREDKGIENFSPFVETKPLKKIPDEWNKRNFTQALLSGQIFMGHVDYRYTDDYALDAANNFSEGIGIDIPAFARDVVEGWASTYYVHSQKSEGAENTCTIGFSEHSNSSKTLHFDLNCNIREAKRRTEERAAGIQAYNAMMKASCIEITPESIDPNMIYSVTSLDEFTNTGVCSTHTDFIQGSYLQQRLDPDCCMLEILKAEELEIVPDKLYEIANFYNPRSYYEPDDRIIDCGNKLQLVTGKALLELTAEGICLPYIKEGTGEYHSIASARESLNKFISGQRHFVFTGLKTGEYEKALEKLNKEAARAGHKEMVKAGIDAMISTAQQKASMESSAMGKNSVNISR